MIILPRQARDKHRESTQKRERRFLIGYVREATTATYRLLRDLEWGESDQAEEGAEEQPTGEVKALLAWLVCVQALRHDSLSLSEWRLTGLRSLLLVSSLSQWLAGVPFFDTSRLRAHKFEFNFGPPRSGSSMRFCGHLLDVVMTPSLSASSSPQPTDRQHASPTPVI